MVVGNGSNKFNNTELVYSPRFTLDCNSILNKYFADLEFISFLNRVDFNISEHIHHILILQC